MENNLNDSILTRNYIEWVRVIDMDQFKDYNIIQYIESIFEVKSVTLDSITSRYNICKKCEFSSSVSGYLNYVEEHPFYVAPSFNDVRTDERLSTLNPKFILFSAPGAVGKSALAKYLSYKFKVPYWNLAKIKLGTNSFAGSILNFDKKNC